MDSPRQVNGKRALTIAYVNSVTKAGKYHDNKGHGLMLRVNESGSKQWVQRVTHEGNRSELGLGSPPVVTLAEARDKALDNKRSIRSGQNPIDERRQRLAVPTFETAAAEACKIQSIGKAKSYDVRFMGGLRLHAFPTIGKKRISDVSPKDIFQILDTTSRNSSDTAKKLRIYLSVVMKWALSNDFISEDPIQRGVIGLPKYSTAIAHRKFLPYHLVNELIEALKVSNASAPAKLALEFLILTAGRSGEIRHAPWDEFDIPAKLWTIPAARMKMNRDHVVPLSDRALEILSEARALSPDSEIVFRSPRGVSLGDVTLSKFVKEGLNYNVDVHGFRTSFRVWTQEKTDCKHDAAELALAHSVGTKVEKAYMRSKLLPERAKLLQDWADYLKIPSVREATDRV